MIWNELTLANLGYYDDRDNAVQCVELGRLVIDGPLLAGRVPDGVDVLGCGRQTLQLQLGLVANSNNVRGRPYGQASRK